MKIWVLNPPYFKHFSRPQRSPAVTKSGTVYYPIWLAGCTGVLEDAGHEVRLTDAPARGHDLDFILKMSGQFNPDMIVVDTSTPSINNDLEVCRRIRALLPHAFIVLVGTHVSALPEETLLRCDAVNAVARREYEITILELAGILSGFPEHETGAQGQSNANDLSKTRDLSKVNSLSKIKGLSFTVSEPMSSHGAPDKKPDNGDKTISGDTGNCTSFKRKIIHNPDRPFIKNLDSLPWVSRVYKKHLSINDYFNPNAMFPMVTLITSRGCPFRCSFCVYPQTLTGRRFRFRSTTDVVNELKFIKDNFPEIKSVFFEDDTLSANKKRCIELSRAIMDAGINIPWTTNSRIDPDLETLKLMKKAGCKSLCVGFESGEQRTLNIMHKGIKKNKMFQFMEYAKKAGILIHGCFMVGFPGETRSDMEKTVKLAMDLKPDTVQFYPVMVYPGTEAYKEYREKGWLTAKSYENWLTPEGLHNCVIKNETFTSDELVRICDNARRQFYLRPQYIFYKLYQIILHPSEAVRTLKAFRTFFKHLIIGSKT